MFGYVVSRANSSGPYIPGAFYVTKDEYSNDSYTLLDDKAAAKVAEKNSVKLIYGMDCVPNGVYLDTEANRAHIAEMLRKHPKLKKQGFSFTAYHEEKLKMLAEFGIEITALEEDTLRSLKSDRTIDSYMREILKKYL